MTPEFRKAISIAGISFLWLLQLGLILIHFLHGIIQTEYWRFVGEDQNILGDAISVVFGGLDFLQSFLPFASLLFLVIQTTLTTIALRQSIIETRLWPSILLALAFLQMIWIWSWG